MSRRLKRTEPQFIPGNTSAVLLTAPEGHKYEVLEGWMSSDGTAGRNLALLLGSAAGATQFVWLDYPTPAYYISHPVFNAVVLNAGDSLSGFAYGDGFSGSGVMLTYVDVAF